MRSQKIVRIVDASIRQERQIIWLECNHKVSVTMRQAMAEPNILRDAERTGRFDCPFCPDPPPAVVRQEKSANQLYKEAGEP